MTKVTPTPETLALRELVDARRDRFDALLTKYGATHPQLFGSVARGTAHEGQGLGENASRTLADDEPDGTCWLFVHAGPSGDAARALMSTNSRLRWTVEADSHFEAMTKYYEHQGWGAYTTEYPELDKKPYAERGWE